MPRGGARPGAGRPKRVKIPVVKKSIAQMVIDDPSVDIIAVFKSLLYNSDARIRFDATRLLIERLEGLPAQSVAMCNPDGTPIGTPLPLPQELTVTFVTTDREPLPAPKTISGIQATTLEAPSLAID